ncbi:hypothetical protein ACF0H5_004171 [Mactra antiquata]
MTRFLCLGVLLLAFVSVNGTPRNIIFIAADDLGWNDVGFHNEDMITPNIDKLAKLGVILNSSYVQPVCTPSRHSWMTGVYPFKVGLQRAALFAQTAQCSPLDLTFLPQRLQKLGYATHMVGKWHLGMCNWNCTPTYRGFDSFLGYYNGMEDYYNKTNLNLNGIDFHDGEKPLQDTTYSTYLYAQRAQKIIEDHDKSKPLFLYLPFQAVHDPIQVPQRFEDMYPNIQTDVRRKYCGMVSALDEAIGNVTDTLRKNNMFDESLIIFTADNGGWVTQGGNNYPLRGGKVTVFEGGTRGAAFVVGSGLEKSGYTYDGMIHAVDWHPTIVAAAGGELPKSEYDSIDGVNQWEALSTGGESKRTEFVYNLDNALMPPTGHAAIRVGKYKLIDGYPGPFRTWYLPDQVETEECNPSDERGYYECLQKRDAAKLKDTEKKGLEGIWAGEGLYDLSVDPNERNDISRLHPDVVKELKKKLNEYRKSLVRPKPQIPVPASNPDNYGGYWMPGWC